MGTGYQWSATRQRVVGVLLMLPILGVIPQMVATCHRGGSVRNASGNLTDNLYALWFIAGLIGALAGARLIALSFQRR